MCAKIQLRNVPFRLKTDLHQRKSQERYKHDYDRHVRNTSVLKPTDYIFVNIHILRSTGDSNAEKMLKKAYNILQPQTAKPFRVIIVHEKTLTIVEHGIPQTVSIYHMTGAPDTTNIIRHQLQENPQREISLPRKSS